MAKTTSAERARRAQRIKGGIAAIIDRHISVAWTEAFELAARENPQGGSMHTARTIERLFAERTSGRPKL